MLFTIDPVAVCMLSARHDAVKNTRNLSCVEDQVYQVSPIAWLVVIQGTRSRKGVDRTRNMEHPGTFRNIPEHEKIKIIFFFLMKK